MSVITPLGPAIDAMDAEDAQPEQKVRGAQPRRKSLWVRFRQDRSLLLMTLPVVVLLIVFAYVPMLGNVVAFQEYSPYVGIAGSPFIGFDNFSRLLQDPAFWHALSNTLAITGFQLVFFFPLPILLAILLNSLMQPWLRTLIQGIVFLPHFFSWVIIVTVFQQILGGAGLISQQLRAVGAEPLNIMTNPDTFILLLTSQTIWRDAGWGIVVFLAALASIDPSQYEAAAVDGASGWRRMWHITLPALRPVIILLLILRLGDALSVGFEQLILQRDAVGAQASEVLDTFVYYSGVVSGDFSYGAAAGLLKGIISLILVLLANKVAHMFGEAGVYKK